MKIALFDHDLLKFSGVLKKHWEELGHEVFYEPGYNPKTAQECDRVFVEHAGTNMGAMLKQKPPKKGKVVVRAIDIDVWVGGASSIDPDYIDEVVFIADHIQEFANRQGRVSETKQSMVPMGVDIDSFSFRKRNHGNKVAYVGRFTPHKRIDLALHIFSDMRKLRPDLEFHLVGRVPQSALSRHHFQHILTQNNIEDSVIFYGELPQGTESINDFLEDKDYFLLTGMKEAFSMVVGEAMAKGIKPIVYNFWRANDIWPSEILFNTPSEAVQLIDSDYNSQYYRDYIKEHYTLTEHLKAMDKVMEL